MCAAMIARGGRCELTQQHSTRGEFGRDPESKTLATGTKVCDFTVASDRFYKQNEEMEKEVSYFDIEAWARLGQAARKISRKAGAYES